MRNRRWLTIALFSLLLMLSLIRPPTTITEAQTGGVLSYGTSVTATIAPELPQILYSFIGTAGDFIQADASGLSGGLQPQIDLLSPSLQTLGTSHRNGLASNPTDSRLAMTLPETGLYALLVRGANSATGDFLLQLSGRTAITATPIAFGQQISAAIPLDAPPQYFSFVAESCPTTLVVLDPTPGDPFSFPFLVKVRDERGLDVAVLRGGEALEDRVTVEPLSGTYEVEVWTADPLQAGTIYLLVTCAADAPACLPGDYSPAPPARCPVCCAAAPTEASGPCADFVVSYEASEGGIVTFSWPIIEGQDAVIWSVVDGTGSLVGARMVENHIGTSDSVDLVTIGSGPGVYTFSVGAFSATEGYLCHYEFTVEYEGTGPVHWGSAASLGLPFTVSLDLKEGGLDAGIRARQAPETVWSAGWNRLACQGEGG